jgi:hypothetical protein
LKVSIASEVAALRRLAPAEAAPSSRETETDDARRKAGSKFCAKSVKCAFF